MYVIAIDTITPVAMRGEDGIHIIGIILERGFIVEIFLRSHGILRLLIKKIVAGSHYFPRPIFGNDGNKNHQTQTRYLQDASYIRLKNLQVGYTLPQNLTRKIALEKVRVFFSAENLWTGTKLNKLFDPETIDDPNGWGGCAYPPRNNHCPASSRVS